MRHFQHEFEKRCLELIILPFKAGSEEAGMVRSYFQNVESDVNVCIDRKSPRPLQRDFKYDQNSLFKHLHLVRGPGRGPAHY